MLQKLKYFDQILGKRESQTQQVLNFTGTKFRENSQKLLKPRNLIPLSYADVCTDFNFQKFLSQSQTESFLNKIKAQKLDQSLEAAIQRCS